MVHATPIRAAATRQRDAAAGTPEIGLYEVDLDRVQFDNARTPSTTVIPIP